MNDEESKELIAFYNEDVDFDGDSYPRYSWVETIAKTMVNIAMTIKMWSFFVESAGEDANREGEERRLSPLVDGVRDVSERISHVKRLIHSGVLPIDERLKVLPTLQRAKESLYPGLLLADPVNQRREGAPSFGVEIGGSVVDAERTSFDAIMDAAMRLQAVAQTYENEGIIVTPDQSMQEPLPDPIRNEELTTRAGYGSKTSGAHVSRVIRTALKEMCEKSGKAWHKRWDFKDGKRGLEWSHKDLRFAFPSIGDSSPLKNFLRAHGVCS